MEATIVVSSNLSKIIKEKSERFYLVSNCCRHKLWNNSTICPKCKEWCKPIKHVEVENKG